MSAVRRIAVTTTTAIAITAMPSILPILRDLALQRCPLLLGPVEQARDLADLGRHPRRRHHGPSPASHDRRAAEDHVQPVAQACRPLDREHVLQDRLALARQRCLGDRQGCRLQEASVRGDRVALGEQQDVAGHELVCRDSLLAPFTQDTGRRRGHPLQRSDCPLRSRLLHVAEDGVGDDDRGDHDRIERQLFPALQRPGNQRDRRREEQQVDQRIGKLAEELPPPRHRSGCLEHVLSDLPKPRSRLRLAEATASIDSEIRDDRGGITGPHISIGQHGPHSRRVLGQPSGSPRLSSVAVAGLARIRADPYRGYGSRTPARRAAPFGAFVVTGAHVRFDREDLLPQDNRSTGQGSPWRQLRRHLPLPLMRRGPVGGDGHLTWVGSGASETLREHAQGGVRAGRAAAPSGLKLHHSLHQFVVQQVPTGFDRIEAGSPESRSTSHIPLTT